MGTRRTKPDHADLAGKWLLGCWQEQGVLPTTANELKARVLKAIDEAGCDVLPGKEDEVLWKLYGVRYELLRLGVPLDVRLPGFMWDGFPSAMGLDGYTEEDRDHDRREYRPAIKAAQKAAAKLRTALQRLADTESRRPLAKRARRARAFVRPLELAAAKDLGETEPPESVPPSERQFQRAFRGVSMVENVIAELTQGLQRQGRPADRKINELVARLHSLGLSRGKIEKAFKVLGFNEAGDSKDRIRQRLRRLPSRGGQKQRRKRR